MPERTPVLFLSHGAPPLADDARWTRELAEWSAALAKPASILMVSAHWEAAPITLSSTSGAPLLYDFWGFPQKYYDVRYAAPAATELAATTERLLTGSGLPTARDESRGLDHGGYVPLVEMYPEADVPVVQLSLPTLEPARLFALGHRLAPLRAFYLATLGGARSLYLDDSIGNFAEGKYADFVVLDPAVSALQQLRIGNSKDIWEKLFVLMTLGDDRNIAQTWVNGRPVWQRDAQEQAA